MPGDDDLNIAIQTLAQSIMTLQKKRGDWVYCHDVAKYQEGSQELASVISGLAQLPAAATYFTLGKNGRVIKLTEAGIQLANSSPKRPKSETEKVADAVKKYAGSLPRLRYEVEAIQPVGKSQKRMVHAISIKLEDTVIPGNAPVTVIPESGFRVSGWIVGQVADEGIIYAALGSTLYPDTLPARLEIDQAFLVYQLAESIAKLPEMPPMSQAFSSRNGRSQQRIANDDSRLVGQELAQLKTPWTRFLWGPPGAGKTFGMAHMVQHLLRQNPQEKILILAPSNIAVDVAISQLMTHLEGNGLGHLISSRQILRYGYPRKHDILTCPEILGSLELEALSKQIGDISRKIKQQGKEGASEEARAILRAQLIDLQEELKQATLLHMHQCKVVATTTAMAYSDKSPIRAVHWDTVLVDEVTMVPPAACLYISSLAHKRLLLAGDPRQLGPIFQGHFAEDSLSYQWMGRDIYDFTGLAYGQMERRHIQVNDGRLVRITTQRRCGPDVWAPIANLYEDVDSAPQLSRVNEIKQVAPEPGKGRIVLDVREKIQGAQCIPFQKSWQNPATAQYVVSLAQQIVEEAGNHSPLSISIIAPYRAQIKLIKKHLKDRSLEEQVEAGTIHQFQGSEADVVIVDLVDGPGRERPGTLLKGETGIRLVNVAISRARGKLIILADKRWCRQAMNRQDNPILWDVLYRQFDANESHIPQHASYATSKQNSVPSRKTQTATLSLREPNGNGHSKNVLAFSEETVSLDKLMQMFVGESGRIANRATKKQISRSLTAASLQGKYDAQLDCTIWRGQGRLYIVDHGQDIITRKE